MIPVPYTTLLFMAMLVGGVLIYLFEDGLPVGAWWESIRQIRLPRPNITPRTASWSALITLAASAFLLDPTALGRPAILALPLVLIAGAMTWIVLRDQPFPDLVIAPRQPTPIRWIPLVGGIALLIYLAEINGRAIFTRELYHVSSHIQVTMFAVGITFIVLGLAGKLAVPRFRLQFMPHLVVLLLTLLALILRVWHIGGAAPVFVDEVNFSNIVMRFWAEGDTPIFMRSDHLYFHFPHLYAYGQWWTVALFGRNLDGLRLFSAFIGALTIPAVYFLGRQLFNMRLGLVAALLLATFPPHMQFSRLAMNNIADPLFGILALAFLTRALKGGQRLDYVLGGVMLGLTQYFYEGGRLLFPALIASWIIATALAQRINWRDIGLFALAAGLVAMPLMYAWFTAEIVLLPRVYYVFHSELPLVPRFVAGLLSYVHLPEKPVSVYYYGGQTAMILPWLVPLFLLGVFYVVKGSVRRKPILWLFPLWFLLVGMGNMLLIEPSMYARYVTIFPALALVMALGLCEVLPRLLTRIYPLKHLQLIVVILLAGISIGQMVYYFVWHLPGFATQFWEYLPGRDSDDALMRALDFPESAQVHFICRQPPDPGITGQKMYFMGEKWSLHTLPSSQLDSEYLEGLWMDTDHAFFIDAGDDDTLRLLSQYFDLELIPYTGDMPYHERFELYYYHAPESD